MPYAIVGVRRDVNEDTKNAVECLRDGFPSIDEALVFAHFIREKSLKEYSELYPERYDGEHWRAIGGRCYLQAYRILTEEYDKLIESGYYGDSPVLVHGYCGNSKMVCGKPVLTGHAWIECKERVLDCGSYILKLSPYEKNDYYQTRNVEHTYRYTREEAKRNFKQTGGLYYPWDPPPEKFSRERAIWEALQ